MEPVRDLHDSRYSGVVPNGKEKETPDPTNGEEKGQGRRVLCERKWCVGTIRGLVGWLAERRSGDQRGIRVEQMLVGVAEIPTLLRFHKGRVEDGGTVFVVRGREQARIIFVYGPGLIENVIQVNGTHIFNRTAHVNGAAVSGTFTRRRRHFTGGTSRVIALERFGRVASMRGDFVVELHFVSIVINVVATSGRRHLGDIVLKSEPVLSLFSML
jgi:hypothetical protein